MTPITIMPTWAVGPEASLLTCCVPPNGIPSHGSPAMCIYEESLLALLLLLSPLPRARR